MVNLFHLNIRTPEKTIFEGRAFSLVAPGSDGYLGILAYHAPLITTLAPGKISVNDGSATKIFNSSGNGIMEVLKNSTTILLESIDSQGPAIIPQA